MVILQSSDQGAPHQLLSLVDNYADEVLIRERAVEDLKSKREELQSEVESACADLERLKENTAVAGEKARELLIELQTVETAVNVKQANLSSQQQEIFKINTLLEHLQVHNKNFLGGETIVDSIERDEQHFCRRISTARIDRI